MNENVNIYNRETHYVLIILVLSAYVCNIYDFLLDNTPASDDVADQNNKKTY